MFVCRVQRLWTLGSGISMDKMRSVCASVSATRFLLPLSLTSCTAVSSLVHLILNSILSSLRTSFSRMVPGGPTKNKGPVSVTRRHRDLYPRLTERSVEGVSIPHLVDLEQTRN
jgi:hypothetical protein